MSEFIESYQPQPKEKPISRVIRGGVILVVVAAGIGVAANLLPELIAEGEKKLALELTATSKITTTEAI